MPHSPLQHNFVTNSSDFLPLGYGRSADEFKSHISSARDRFPGETIVVSEFALEAPASADDQAAFFRDTTGWLEGQDYVAMYFPFVATSPGLLSQNDGAAAGYVGTGCTLFNVRFFSFELWWWMMLT